MANPRPLRSNELPFDLPEDLSDSIDRFVDARLRNDLNIDCYECDLMAATRQVDDDTEAWLWAYYVNGGWRKLDPDAGFPEPLPTEYLRERRHDGR